VPESSAAKKKSPIAMPRMQLGSSRIKSAQAMLRRSRMRMVTDPQTLSTVHAGTRTFTGTTRPINGTAAAAPKPVAPRSE
jgi:hypothetical protein